MSDVHRVMSALEQQQEHEILLLQQRVAELEAIVNANENTARNATPKHGWGTQSLVNIAWKQGWRDAAAEIGDSLRQAATAAGGDE